MASPATTPSYHVAGPITIQANIGSASAFVNVGVCEDGADVELRPFTSDIKFDGAGGPAGDAGEIIFLNFTAIVRCNLVPFAGAYVNKLRAMSQANGAGTEGVMVVPGTLFGGNSNLPTIKWASGAGEVDGGWLFTYCQVRNPGSNKASTLETKPNFEFRAINYVNPASSPVITSSVLYSRV